MNMKQFLNQLKSLKELVLSDEMNEQKYNLRVQYINLVYDFIKENNRSQILRQSIY